MINSKSNRFILSATATATSTSFVNITSILAVISCASSLRLAAASVSGSGCVEASF